MTDVPTLSAVVVTFNTAMNPATLTAQTTSGACSGSIQVSTDDFATCLSFASAAPTMSGGNTVATLAPAPAFSDRSIHAIRVTTAAASAAGDPLGATYTSGTGFTTAGAPAPCDGSVVISQVYGGGGNTGAAYKNDFIELHNRGTANGRARGLVGAIRQRRRQLRGASPTTILAGGTIAPAATTSSGGGGAGATACLLPAADATGTIDMSATVGKVALVEQPRRC